MYCHSIPYGLLFSFFNTTLSRFLSFSLSFPIPPFWLEWPEVYGAAKR